MAEYIQSNDDSSNLALYAGIGGIAAGAALAYRMTRDPSNGKSLATADAVTKGKNGLVMKYDGEGKASALKGGARALTLGLFSSEQRAKGMSEFAHATLEKGTGFMGSRRGAATSENYTHQLNTLSDIGAAGQKSVREADLDRAISIIDNGGTTKKGSPKMNPQSALDEVMLKNPYTAITEDDIQKRLDRRANKEAKRKSDLQEVARSNGATHSQTNRLMNARDLDADWASALDAHTAEINSPKHKMAQAAEEARRNKQNLKGLGDMEDGKALKIMEDAKKSGVGRGAFANNARSQISQALSKNGTVSSKTRSRLEHQASQVGMPEGSIDKLINRVQSTPIGTPEAGRYATRGDVQGTAERARARAAAESAGIKRSNAPVAPVAPKNTANKTYQKNLATYQKSQAEHAAVVRSNYDNKGVALRNDLRERGHKIGNRPNGRMGGKFKALSLLGR